MAHSEDTDADGYADTEDGADVRLGAEAGPRCEAGVDGYYHHPLQGVAKVDGKVPFLDVQVSPEGRLYALHEGGHEDEDGIYRDFGRGIVELAGEAIDDAELHPELPSGIIDDYVHEKFGPGVTTWLATAALDDTLLVDIAVARPPTETATLRINRGIAAGAIATYSEREEYRRDVMTGIAHEVSTAMAPLVEFLDSEGAALHRVGTYTTSVRASLGRSTLEQLISRDDVVRVDTIGMSAVASANGSQKAEAMQHRLFWQESFTCGALSCNYEGDNGTAADIYIAVADPQEFRDDHVAFREGTGAVKRIASMWNCGPFCTPSGGWSPPVGDHGTAVLSAVLGDLRDGQDAARPGVAEREERSAAGGEARAYLYAGTPSDLAAIMDHIAGPTHVTAPHFLVSSMGSFTPPPDWGDCNGDTGREIEVDQFFQNGFLLFQAAGNDLDVPVPQTPNDTPGIDGSTSNCTVWEPGSALSAFTVGAYDQGAGAPWEMRTGAVWPESAWGGAPLVMSEGRLRTVIDVLGPWSNAGLATTAANNTYGTAIGTSFANPSVTANAVAFIDMMKNLRSSNALDDPGMLAAWMLNIGDRGNGFGFGSKLTSSYSQRYGAGRAMNRFVGNAGMDAPWYWRHWETCVPHGTNVILPIADGNVLPASVDSIRATAWWYDRRFSSGTALDNIGLSVRRADGTTLRSSNTFDNKERVHAQGVGGYALDLVLSGTSVTSDVEGCGVNSMRVWVTALIEDDARNDADGPTWDSVAREGIQPL